MRVSVEIVVALAFGNDGLTASPTATAPETLEGWYALHQIFSIDRIGRADSGRSVAASRNGMTRMRYETTQVASRPKRMERARRVDRLQGRSHGHSFSPHVSMA